MVSMRIVLHTHPKPLQAAYTVGSPLIRHRDRPLRAPACARIGPGSNLSRAMTRMLRPRRAHRVLAPVCGLLCAFMLIP